MLSRLHALTSKSLGQGNGKRMVESKLRRVGVCTPDESSLPAVIPSTRTPRWTSHSSPTCPRRLQSPRRRRTLSQTLKTPQVLQVLLLLRVLQLWRVFPGVRGGSRQRAIARAQPLADFISRHLPSLSFYTDVYANTVLLPPHTLYTHMCMHTILNISM